MKPALESSIFMQPLRVCICSWKSPENAQEEPTSIRHIVTLVTLIEADKEKPCASYKGPAQGFKLARAVAPQQF